MQETQGINWTFYLAAYGAILATAVAVYNALSEWKARRPDIKVEASWTVRAFAENGFGEDVLVCWHCGRGH